MTQTHPQIQAIGQINIPVHNLDNATHFYQNILGLNLIFQVSNMMSFFDCNGVRLVLAVPTSTEFDHPSSIIYFSVNDIHVAHQTLLATNVEFTQNPHTVGTMGDVDVWMAFFKDPNGNHLAIMSEVKADERT